MAEHKTKQRPIIFHDLGALALVFLLQVPLLQPLLSSLMQFVGEHFAGAAKITLSYRVQSSTFSTLTLQDVSVSPMPENKDFPIERLQAKTVALRYNLIAALHKDWAHTVQLVSLQDVDVVIRQTPPQPKKAGGPLKFPAVIPEQVDIDHFNLTMQQSAGDVQVRDLFLHLRQNQPGNLGWQEVAVPGVGHWSNVQAGVTNRNGVLEITSLNLAPLVDVGRLALDLSRSADGIFGADLNGTALDAPLELHAAINQGDLTEPSAVNLRLGRLDLNKLQPVVKLPLTGAVSGTEAQLTGDIAHPNTWSGLLRTRVENLKYQTYEAQAVGVDTEFHGGAGEINQISVRSGPNAVQVAGTYQLPNDLDDFLTQLNLDAGLAIAAPQPELYVPDLHGKIAAAGSVGLRSGAWQAAIGARIQDLAARGLAVPGTAAHVFASGRLPLEQNLWTSFQAIVLTDVQNVTFNPVQVPSIRATVVLPGTDEARLQATVRAAQSRIDLSAQTRLPAGGAPFDPKQVDAELNLAVPSAADFLNPRLYTGALGLEGHVAVHELKPQGVVRLHGDQITYEGATLQAMNANVRLEGDQATVESARIQLDAANYIELNGKAGLSVPYPYQAFGQVSLPKLDNFNPFLKAFKQPEGLAGTLQATFSGHGDTNHLGGQFQATGEKIQYRGVTVQTVQLASALADNQVQLQSCHLGFDPGNTVDLSGNVQVKDPRPFSLSGQVQLTNLGAFNPALKQFGQPEGLSGSLGVNATANGNLADALASTAGVTINARQLKYRGLTIQTADVQAGLADRRVNVSAGRIVFDQKDTVDVRGNSQVTEPYTYNADATVAFQDIGFLNGLATSFGQNLDLAGRLNLKWNGQGELRNSTGKVELHGDGLRAKPVQGVKVDVAGNYQGSHVEVPTLAVGSPYADLTAALRFDPQRFEIPNLKVTKNGNTITGNAAVPLDLRPGAKVPVSLDQPLQVSLQADNVSIASFQPGKPQATGYVGFQLLVSKTLQDPLVNITTTVRDLRSTAVSSLSAASSDIQIRLADKVLTVQGQVRQADIQPIQLQGRVPVDLGQVIDSRRLPDDTPLQLSLQWPSTNLAFVQKVVPVFRRIEGRAGANVSVGGTLKKPVLAGDITADIPRIQAKTDAIPPISNFVTRIGFRQDHVQIDQLTGLAGGGAFRGNGTINLVDGTNPKFDITATGNQVLFTRSDNVIVRGDFDLAIRGPLSGGEVSGRVGVVDSRFFQDIDILPLNLPGRPAPKPPSIPRSNISITTPPLRDWKFNISVQTARPFLIQSNLARGRVTIDLHVGGTGLQPVVTGFVRVDHLTASLPFSHLDINNGYINFPPGSNPFDPALNIIGTSTIQDYDVHVRIFGSLSNFQILFDSTPPLSQGDIATLLATGATTQEFTENPSLLAGRATFILAQQLLHKIFKFKPSSQEQSFLERVQVNIIPGSRPGTQDVSARFDLTKDYQLIGEVGQEGDVGLRLRYLIRFR